MAADRRPPEAQPAGPGLIAADPTDPAPPPEIRATAEREVDAAMPGMIQDPALKARVVDLVTGHVVEWLTLERIESGAPRGKSS